MQLLYDRDCPVCDYYCQRISIDTDSGELLRIDARDQSDILSEVTDLGLDIDAGMVLKVDETIYYGSDALNELAMMSSKKGFVNRLASWLFRHPGIARTVYPILAACRNLLLKLLGRSRINNLDTENNARF